MMRKITSCILAGVAAIALAGCASQESANNRVGENKYFDSYAYLNEGQWEDAISSFQKQIGRDEPELIALLGLARAQIGAEKWEDANQTLNSGLKRYPADRKLLERAGWTANKLNRYDEAVVHYTVMWQETPKDSRIRMLLVENLWLTTEFDNIYHISLELYKQYPDDSEYLKNVLRACSIVGIEGHIQEILDISAGSRYEELTKALYESYEAAKAGQEEQAKDLLFRSELMKELHLNVMFVLGDCGADGKRDGVTVAIWPFFGEPGAIVGRQQNDVWEGMCSAWKSRINETIYNEWTGNSISGVAHKEVYMDGIWQNGKPEGEYTIKEINYSVYEQNPSYEWYHEDSTKVNFVNGKAEGRTITERRDESDESIRQIIHEFKEGKPVPFSYEDQEDVFEVDIYRGHIYSQKEECYHDYIWE